MSRCLLFITLVCGTSAIAKVEPVDLKSVAADAISDDCSVATIAIDRLRAAGPAGLAALFDAHHDLLDSNAASASAVAGLPTELPQSTEDLRNGVRPAIAPAAGSGDPRRAQSVEDPADPRLARLRSALDAVGAQRDCDTSQLYWYTDLTTAVDAARREGKPILSLRLLGKLTDEFSCANSRYFRASLYANREIGDYLRDHFVLHWQTFRPVPRVTIDYGDGRKLERTLTGNSIHYVLDTAGRPFDALPGLYGPQAFLRELRQIEEAVASYARLDDTAGNAFFLNFHQQHLKSIQSAWQRDLAALKVDVPAQILVAANGVQPGARRRRGGAVRAGELAAGKGGGENPLLKAFAANAAERFRMATTNEVWLRLGALHHNDALLDDASIAIMRRQNPTPAVTDQQGSQSQTPEEALAAMVENFQAAMAVDTVRNEYDLHRQLHEWFASGIDRELESLNERVYAELFLTPRADPWLGLVSPEVYTGLEGGGRRE